MLQQESQCTNHIDDRQQEINSESFTIGIERVINETKECNSGKKTKNGKQTRTTKKKTYNN